ncbi:MAG: hypothetical protein ABFD76_06055, partial [Smithella sp.]
GAGNLQETSSTDVHEFFLLSTKFTIFFSSAMDSLTQSIMLFSFFSGKAFWNKRSYGWRDVFPKNNA